MGKKMKKIQFVVPQEPLSGQQFVAYSTNRNGVDIIVNKPLVEIKQTLADYTRYTVSGVTDTGESVKMVLRTISDSYELKFQELSFQKS